MLKKAITGFIAGIINGLFASGGGMILVVALIHLFHMDDSKARATSVFTILPIAITSSLFYCKDNYMNLKIGMLCAIGGILGGYIGAKLLTKLSTKFLKILFTLFLIYSSIKMIF